MLLYLCSIDTYRGRILCRTCVHDTCDLHSITSFYQIMMSVSFVCASWVLIYVALTLLIGGVSGVRCLACVSVLHDTNTCDDYLHLWWVSVCQCLCKWFIGLISVALTRLTEGVSSASHMSLTWH